MPVKYDDLDDEEGLVHDQDFDLGVHLGDTPTDSLGPEDADEEDEGDVIDPLDEEHDPDGFDPIEDDEDDLPFDDDEEDEDDESEDA